jgi:hypothetical protein
VPAIILSARPVVDPDGGCILRVETVFGLYDVLEDNTVIAIVGRSVHCLTRRELAAIQDATPELKEI